MTRFAAPAVKAAALAAVMAVPMAAAAKPALRDVKEIDDRMLWVALAIEISDRCESISPRTLKGLAYLYSLKNRAEALGYTEAEIKAYVDSDAEKARMRKRGEAYVRAQGLDPDSDADLCTLGKREIGKGSQIGAFLND